MTDIAVFDFETDPFKHRREPKPFAVGYYDGDRYLNWWGDDCVDQIADFIKSIYKPTIIYAHNGGKFDFIFLLKHFQGKLHFQGDRRILSGCMGACELRDSWGIIPEPLGSAAEKLKIDYAKMERATRELHKEEILTYLKQDCVGLHELVTEFHAEFGNRLTIGGTAMREIKKRHSFDQADENFDEKFRQFYYGGRCQVLEPGIHHGRFIMVDINSAYSHAMASIDHPTGLTYVVGNKITSKTDFAIVRARNYGALPVKTKTGISFDSEDGFTHERYGKVFCATIHEIEAGLETGTLDLLEVMETRDFHKRGNFAEFINHFQEKKVEAEQLGRKIHRDFYKRVNNSGYGKFAQRASDFCDYCITAIDEAGPEPLYHERMNEDERQNAWRASATAGDYIIWEKPSRIKTWYNIATAASITGATRAFLMRGIAASVRPMYCDTDSIICEAFNGETHDTKLGAWKLEKLGLGDDRKKYDHADMVAIARKKLYAMFLDGKGVKMASKGARLTADQILQIAQGKVITYEQEAPVFKLTGGANWIKRRIQRGDMVNGTFGRR